MSISAEGEFHLQYERIFSGVAKDRLTIQRKCACVSLISMGIEACYYSLAWKVERGKTRRDIASLLKAERYMSINCSVSSTIEGRRIRGIMISCGTL